MELVVIASHPLLAARLDALAIFSHTLQQPFVFDRIIHGVVEALVVLSLVLLLRAKLKIFSGVDCNVFNSFRWLFLSGCIYKILPFAAI